MNIYFLKYNNYYNRTFRRENSLIDYLDYEVAFNNVGYEGNVEFRNGKKPMDFLEKCFEMSGVVLNKNSIVLDFFAGSGSTGHICTMFSTAFLGIC